MNNVYHIKILQPAPSMCDDKEVFTADSYQDAVNYAHTRFAEVGRRVALYSGEFDMYYWHRITKDGAEDRNTGSGVVIPGVAR